MTADDIGAYLVVGSVVVGIIGVALWLRVHFSNDPRPDGAVPPLIEWRRSARSLPRSTRRTVAGANRRGAAAPPDLALLAAERAEAAIADLDNSRRPPRELVVRGAFWLYFAMFIVGSNIPSPALGAWGLVGLALFTIASLAQVIDWLRRPTRRRHLVRSLELNRALLNDPAGLSA